MNVKKTLIAALVAVGCMSASAQEAETEYVFNPHWYVQGQLGGQYTLGEVDFSDLLSPNAQIGVGYNFNSLFGLRLDINAWQSRAGIESDVLGGTYKWKWNYINPNLNATFNLSNAIAGFNPKRLVDVTLYAGLGVNFAWGNDEAKEVREAFAKVSKDKDFSGQDIHLRKYWDKNKTLLNLKFGADVDFRLNDNFKVGLALQANTLGDSYNSKEAPNWDWHFDALVGVKYAFGKTYTKKDRPAPKTEVVYQDRIVEKVVTVHDTITVGALASEKIRRDVFFTIANSTVSKAEMPKVEDIAAYLNKYPNAKVTVTGYADKGTGNAKLNKMYGERRANIVAELLMNKFGIAKDRIIIDSKGDSEQPYEQNDLNRVSICVAE